MWGEGPSPPPLRPLGHLWVQARTDNAYLNLRALLRALFYIISSSRRSPEELFLRSGNSPTSVCPSNSPSVNISCYRINTTGRIFLNLVKMFPWCLVVQVLKRIPVRRQTWPPSAMFYFSCYCISLETTWRIRMELAYWQAGYRISSTTTGRIFFRYGPECSPQCLVVQEPKPKPKSSLLINMAAVGQFWFFLLSHRLRNEWNLPIRLASMSSWILVKWWKLAFWFPASLSVWFNA